MPTAAVRDIAMHCETEGSGDPLILIPYLSADHACYAFQAPEYSKHFTCVAVDLRGTGTSDKPAGPYSMEQMGDDVATLMEVLDIDRAHVAGVSFGAAAGMWLAAKVPRAGRLVVAPQCLGENGPLPRGRREELAAHGSKPWKRG